MRSVDEALELVLARCEPRAPLELRLSEALGLRLAEDIASDVNSPPHDKAMVDGYAVLADDVARGPVELRVQEEVTAGEVPRRAVLPGNATRIMTGAPIPENANAVVMVEWTESREDRVRIDAPRAESGMNIMRLGTSLRRGEVVLRRERLLRPIEIGLLSEVGRGRVRVIPRPQVAILATGNELVPVAAVPDAGKIRNSNGPMLAAAVTAAGALPTPLGIARDDLDELRVRISEGLQADVLLLTGGVSAGTLDLVPRVLAELGVEQVLHKVRLKPGKPLWFGVKEDPRGPRLVFGLPGNPISGFVCFHLFVRPALARLAGGQATSLPTVAAELTCEFTHRGDRPTYHPAQLQTEAGHARVTPVAWHGSADIRGFAEANALVCFPSGDQTHAAGATLPVLPL